MKLSIVTALAAVSVVISLAGCGTPGPALGGIAGGTALLGVAPGQEIEQVYYLGMFDPLEQLPPSVYRITVHGQASAMSLTKFASGWVPAAMCDTLNTNIQFNESGRIQLTGDASGADTAAWEEAKAKAVEAKLEYDNAEKLLTAAKGKLEELNKPVEDAKKDLLEKEKALADETDATKKPALEEAVNKAKTALTKAQEELKAKAKEIEAATKAIEDAKLVVAAAKTHAEDTAGLAQEQKRISAASLKLGRRMIMFGPEGFMEAPKDHRLVIVMGSDPSKFFEAIGTGLQQVVDVQQESALSGAHAAVMNEYYAVTKDYERALQMKADLGGLRDELRGGQP